MKEKTEFIETADKISVTVSKNNPTGG